ncbi:hypothetical protein HPG69_002314, partial [Diceros bicornis minor]
QFGQHVGSWEEKADSLYSHVRKGRAPSARDVDCPLQAAGSHRGFSTEHWQCWSCASGILLRQQHQDRGSIEQDRGTANKGFNYMWPREKLSGEERDDITEGIPQDSVFTFSTVTLLIGFRNFRGIQAAASGNAFYRERGDLYW